MYNNQPKTTSIQDDDLHKRQASYPEELRRVLQSTGILKETLVEPHRPAQVRFKKGAYRNKGYEDVKSKKVYILDFHAFFSEDTDAMKKLVKTLKINKLLI